MIGGVNFQPGAQDQEQRRTSPSGSNQGIQEAIKVLSLRLPKVVGAQGVAPSALLTAQGARGNSRVDSIVESVMQKFFPQASQAPQMAAPMQPQVEQEAPPSPQQQYARPERQATSIDRVPRVIVENPWEQLPGLLNQPQQQSSQQPMIRTQSPQMPGLDGSGFPPATIAPLPDLRRQLDWLPPPDAGRPYEI